MIRGFAVCGYRSFGPDLQVIAPLKKINVFVGKNNSGKSNILRALSHLASFSADRRKPQALDSNIDFHRGTRTATPRWGFPLFIDDSSLDDLTALLVRDESARTPRIKGTIRGILSALPKQGAGAAWFTFDPAAAANSQLISPSTSETLHASRQTRPPLDWSTAWHLITQQTGGSLEQHHVPQLLGHFANRALEGFPSVYQIGAHRQVGQPGSKYDGLDGSGLISRLLELQNPELAKRGDLRKFEQINQFVKTVVGSSDARLEVPHSGQELLVELDGRVLPIQSLGTGIQEVVIFAAAATTVDEAIVCIEEPEIHLHPRLQRKLLDYLLAETKNQYFITTHSASLLDAPDIGLFHVRLSGDGETEVESLSVSAKRAGVAFDLGYRASDLVQSNAIIWVEGPSDRIYVNAWLGKVAPDLEEGLHYSVMFYGGRLISHLTADDASVAEFISLQRLNRHVAVVFDSDKRTVNATKQRVIDELSAHGGHAWVTKGKEIENYISPEAMHAALTHLHPNMKFEPVEGSWMCRYKPKVGDVSSVDKIALARTVTQSVDLSVLDLEHQVNELAKFVRSANA